MSHDKRKDRNTILSIRMNGQRQNKRRFGIGHGRRRWFLFSFFASTGTFLFSVLCLARQTESACMHLTHLAPHSPLPPNDAEDDDNNGIICTVFLCFLCTIYFENVIIFSALGLLAFVLMRRDALAVSLGLCVCVFFLRSSAMHQRCRDAAISDYNSFVWKFISSAFVSNTSLIRCQRMEKMELLLQFNSHCLDEKFGSLSSSKPSEAQKVFNSIMFRMRRRLLRSKVRSTQQLHWQRVKTCVRV